MKPVIPPPLFGLLFAGLIWLTNRLMPTFSFEFLAREGIAVLLGLLGIGIDVAAIVAFRMAKTTVNPLAPQRAATIVEAGPFGLSRNPMYLGMAFILLGWITWLGNPLGLLWLLAFLVVITYLQIKPEERALLEKFGGPYQEYLQRVRRWI